MLCSILRNVVPKSLQVLRTIKCLIQGRHACNLKMQLVDNREYQKERYTRLLKPDHEQPLPRRTFCHLLCAVNRTCAAVSYNEDTHICYMSAVPEVVNISGAEANALVKMSFIADLNVTVIEGWSISISTTHNH